jgi:hypothetical protein
MKKAENRATRKGFMLQQCRRGAPGMKRLRGRQHNAPAPSAVMLEHGRRGHALGAVLALALLLFASLGLLAAITGASARTPNQLSAHSWAERPTKTPPPRRSPTPTTVPSPTAPATPAPALSPTSTATPTTKATVPASAAPPVKATTPAATGKPGGRPRPTPVSTPSTGSPAVHHPSRVQHKGGGAFVPLVLGTLSGIVAVALLVAGGRWLLRQWLLPVRKVKGPPSGAAPWQRVRTTSLPGSMNSPGDRRQPFPTPDAFLPATRNSLPSQSGGLVSHELLWAKMAGHVADAAGKSSSAILPRQNSRPMAPMRERESAKSSEEML